MMKIRKEKYLNSGMNLIKHLDGMLNPDEGYPDEPSWGYAFTLLATLVSNNGFNNDLVEKSLFWLKQQDTHNPNYSWEFVIFALQKAKHESKELIVFPDNGYREKGTRMFNWFLLRNVNKKLCGVFGVVDAMKLRLSSYLYQDKEGLILDEFKTRSLQYHAFCLFVLAELLDIMPDKKWIKRWFLRGIEFSIDQILPDGTALYLGRGQEQIFGYGSLLYALEYCHHKVKPLDENILSLVSQKVLSFQRPDGSYPLVLCHREPEPAFISFKLDKPAGWYGYNTLYDYQPFLAYCLLKAARLQ